MREKLSELNRVKYDIAIVGGGINGCAISHLLASEGYKVIVVDKDDFATGATSRSARILHCGLRHMAPDKSVWEFFRKPGSLITKLLNTRDMARGQVELAQSIPSRLRKVNLAIPIYKGDGYSGWHVDIGARLIRFINRDEVPMNYRRWKNVSKATHPFASFLPSPDEVRSLVALDDLQFNWPERIAIDSILNAEDMGAELRNFTEVKAMSQQSDGGWSLSLSDVENPRETAEIRAKLVLNLAGHWIDEVARRVRTSNKAARRVIPVKGVHLLVKLAPEFKGAGLVGVNSENEPFFCLPFGDNHYIGPTETAYDGDLDDIRADDEDIDFILDEAARILPQAKLKREDVILTWSGVRPITYDEKEPNGRLRLPYGVIQDFASDGMRNMLGVTWGIIVTHRSTARAVLREVAKRVKPSGHRTPISSYERPFAASSAPALQMSTPYTADHVRQAVEKEHARDLRGVFFGRLGIGWTGRIERSAVNAAAATMAQSLGWSEAQQQDRVAAFEAYLSRYHNYDLA
jgi:glycerol-3-phosphate dehydrogenase